MIDMQYPVFTLVAYAGSFIALWISSGVIITRVSQLARSLKLSPFLVSFFVLGMLTSLPEIMIAGIAVVEDTPLIFVGNLLGGIPIIFFCIIPLLGILNKKIAIPHRLTLRQIVLTLCVVIAPSIMAVDQRIEVWEGWALVSFYSVMFVYFMRMNNMFHTVSIHPRSKTVQNLFSLCVCTLVLYISSRFIVQGSQEIASYLKISSFIVSFLFISLGTNLPELSLVFRSFFSRKSDIALGDYLGSASANTLIFGVSTILYGKTIELPEFFWGRLITLSFGLLLFFLFARSKHELSRKESGLLLVLYILLTYIELRAI